MTNIFFTFDYELGMTRAGTVEKSLISPTNSYCEVFAKYGVRATWFVDAAYLLKLNQLIQVGGG